MIASRLIRRILVLLTFLVWSVSAVAFVEESAQIGWWLLCATTILTLFICTVLARAFGAYALKFGWKLDERQLTASRRADTYGYLITATGFGLLVGARTGYAAVTTFPQFATLSFPSGALIALALLFFSSNVLAFAWLEPDPIPEAEENLYVVVD